MGYLPLFVRLDGWRVLVVGGGSVGTRRALFFASGGARVTVVAEEFSEELLRAEREGRVRLVRARVSSVRDIAGLVEESQLVVVAVPDERLAREVADYALSKGKLVNNAVDHRYGNVIVPFHATVYGGALAVAVTSFGRAGVAARRALERIVEVLESDSRLRLFYEVFEEAKREARRLIPDAKRRMEAYMAIDRDPELNKLVAEGRAEEARRRALEIVKSYATA